MPITATRHLGKQPWMFATFAIVVVLFFFVVLRSTAIPSQAEIVTQVWHLTQNDMDLDIEKVVSLSDDDWQAIAVPAVLGMSADAHWLKVKLPPSDSRQWLELNYPLVDRVDIWFFTEGSQPQLIDNQVVGDSLPFAQRPFIHENFVFDLSQYQRAADTAIIKVQSEGMLRVPLRLWAAKDFTEHTSSQRISVGIFFGLLAAMAISNFFFFITSRKATFLIYSAYVLCVTLVLSSLLGYSYNYLWPDSPWLQKRALGVFANAAIMLAIMFTSVVLDLPSINTKLSRVTKVLAGVFLLNMLLSLVLPYFHFIQLFLVLLLIAVVLVFGFSLWLSIKNVGVARHYTLAWSVLLATAFTTALDNLHVINLPVPSGTMLLYGVVAETLLLALVLAISYGAQQEELENAQSLALNREKEMAVAKDQLLEVEQRAKDDLEYKVQERTLELEITLRELSEANQELERLNTIDALTGIRNRRHFDKRLLAEGRRSRREQTNLCLVMLDIDHFKRINDEYGHDVGDVCIKHIASLAKKAIKRPSDDLCRYGGEEFAFILPNTDEAGAEQFINGIRQSIESTPCQADDVAVNMTISAGIASAIVSMDNEENKILKAADKALYAAKQNGRNRVVVAAQQES